MGIFRSVDALRACDHSPRLSDYQVRAAGAAATDRVVQRDFLYRGNGTLGNLVSLADAELGVPAALITVIHACSRAKHRYPSIRAERSDAMRFEVVQSIIVQKHRRAMHRDIVMGEDGQPVMFVNDDDTGKVQPIDPWKKSTGLPYVQFAPFDFEHPPTNIIDARTKSGDIGLWVAGTGTELVIPSIQQIQAVEQSIMSPAA
jgi:hypothetical protein